MNPLDQKQRSAVVFPSVSIGRSGPPLPAIKWKEILLLKGYLKDCEKILNCMTQNGSTAAMCKVFLASLIKGQWLSKT